MAPMTEQSKPASAWSKRLAFLLGVTTRANEFADLLATVDPCWHAAVQVVNSDVVVRYNASRRHAHARVVLAD